MQKIMQWAGSQGNWAHSGFGGLPSVQLEADTQLQQWQVVAGGLALVLSRVSATERSARFHATNRMYRGLRRRLRQGMPIDASTELLSDVMHEIAEVADRLTTNCLRSCFDARLPGGGQDMADDTEFDTRATSRMQSQPRQSTRTNRGPEWHETTAVDLNHERLVRRASALRDSLAAARGAQQAQAQA